MEDGKEQALDTGRRLVLGRKPPAPGWEADPGGGTPVTCSLQEEDVC